MHFEKGIAPTNFIHYDSGCCLANDGQTRH